MITSSRSKFSVTDLATSVLSVFSDYHCPMLTAGVQGDGRLSLLDDVLADIDDDDTDHNSLNTALYLVTHGYGGDEDKVKVLHKACYWGKLDVVKELVEQHKVDPNSECCYTVVGVVFYDCLRIL